MRIDESSGTRNADLKDRRQSRTGKSLSGTNSREVELQDLRGAAIRDGCSADAVGGVEDDEKGPKCFLRQKLGAPPFLLSPGSNHNIEGGLVTCQIRTGPMSPGYE